MKILYHHRTASKDGQAVHIDEMIAALRDEGHEVLVVAPGSHERKLGADVGWIRRLRTMLPRAAYEILELGYSVVAYRRLAKAVKEFRPQVIYERYNLYLLAGILAKSRFGLPLLLEVNAPLAQERSRFGGLGLPWLARWAEGVVWRAADRVLPVTAVLGQYVSARGVGPERIVVIPNGINVAHFAAAPAPASAKRAQGWDDDALVLGFTGFVRDWHGVDRVLHWMASDGAPGRACLLIVGDGPARAALERLAVQLRLEHRVRFTGVIPREEVPAMVAAFDIALQPAVVDYASPLKLFEYLALAKAIVAPLQPNLLEVLADGENALMFDAGATNGLEDALTRLCADSALRGRIAQGAGATIERLGLTWLNNARRVAQLAGELVEG